MPKLVDETVPRDGSATLEEEQRKQRALPATTKRKVVTVPDRFDCPEQSELQHACHREQCIASFPPEGNVANLVECGNGPAPRRTRLKTTSPEARHEGDAASRAAP